MTTFAISLSPDSQEALALIKTCLAVHFRGEFPYFHYVETPGLVPKLLRTELERSGQLLLEIEERAHRIPRDLNYPAYVRYTRHLAQSRLLASYAWQRRSQAMYGRQERAGAHSPEPTRAPRYTYTDFFTAPVPDMVAYLHTNIRVTGYHERRRVVTLEVSDELRQETATLPLSVVVSWNHLFDEDSALALKYAYFLYLRSTQQRRLCERLALEPYFAYHHYQMFET